MNASRIKPSVFISYSSSDKPFIDQLVSDLKAAQLEVWIDEWEMISGDHIKNKLFKEGIPQCDLFFAYLTPNSLSSPWCRRELNAAFIQQQARKGGFITVFVDSKETRGKLGKRVRDLVTPVLNRKNYSRALAQLITTAWHSLQERGKLVVPQSSHGRIEAGVGLIRRTGFLQNDILKNVRKELILAGPNLRSWLTKKESRKRLLEFITKNDRAQVKFLLGTYSILQLLGNDGERHWQQSVRDLEELRSKLSPRARARVDFRFHPGVATLSAVFIDPEGENGTVFFTPRWGVDLHPHKRLTAVIRKKEDEELFAALYDSILIFSQPTVQGLDDVLLELESGKK